MDSTNFTGTNLDNAVFNQAFGQNTEFSNAVLTNTGWTNSLFVSPNFTNANFFGAAMSTNRMENADTNGAQNLDTVTGCAWPGLPFAGLAACW